MIRGAQILVVEDEPLSRDVLVRMLHSRGLMASSVSDGAACLEWIEDNPVDLVLLDVSMPGMSGLDVLQVIRQKYSHDQLPVILVTAMVDSEDMVAGLDAGANDYVIKPVNLPVLIARIRVALRVKQGAERLIKAESHRVMLESLDDTCEQLEVPMTEVIGNLESILESIVDGDEETRKRIGLTLDWANRVGELIRRFRKIAKYQTVPYTEGIGSFVAASIESASRADDLPQPAERHPDATGHRTNQ